MLRCNEEETRAKTEVSKIAVVKFMEFCDVKLAAKVITLYWTWMFPAVFL